MHKGFKFGAQDRYIKNVLGLRKMRGHNTLLKKNVCTPVDFALNVDGKREEFTLDMFPATYEIFDIGHLTVDKYVAAIKKAKSLFVKGTPGYSEDERFRFGTLKVLKAVAKSKAYSLLAGGHTMTAVKRSRLGMKNFSYVSLAGGALVDYLAGEKLPGLEVLEHV
jgi:phosphoglycerate kinase